MRVEILGAKIHGVTMEEALNRIAAFIAEGTPHQVITLNAEILYRATKEPELMSLINSADLVTPDGSGVVWASGQLAQPVPERVTGIDLLEAIAKKADTTGWKLFLYGSAPGVAEKAAANFQKKYNKLQIAGTSHGFVSSKEMGILVQKIKTAQPDVLLVALGAPRQEFWIRDHLEETGVPAAIGVGGSFDVIAGVAQRAPGWVQKVRLEWLYRLVKEPWRYKRMLALPKFMGLVLREKRKRK